MNSFLRNTLRKAAWPVNCLWLVWLASIAPPASAQQYPKVIVAGDYADPSIMREGPDYYLTHSAFYYAPGLLIWHSQDLVHWEPVVRAITKRLSE